MIGDTFECIYKNNIQLVNNTHYSSLTLTSYLFCSLSIGFFTSLKITGQLNVLEQALILLISS